MAVYILIKRVAENEESAEYNFGLSEDSLGRLRIDKVNGKISLLVPAPGDERNRIYFRAAAKVTQHWSEGKLPENTCWAS